jgi:predicted ATPase
VQQRAEAQFALANEQGFPQWSAFGLVFRGWALVMQGQTEEGLNQIYQGTARAAPVPPTMRLALLAEAYGKVGQVEKGLTTLTEGLETVSGIGWRMYEAELYRLKGELTLQRCNVQGATPKEAEAEAEACFHKAIEIATRQSAKSLELRAVMSLAKLWQRQGKPREAHEMLAEIYGWFTEGFDTKDLQEAKALLEELT